MTRSLRKKWSPAKTSPESFALFDYWYHIVVLVVNKEGMYMEFPLHAQSIELEIWLERTKNRFQQQPDRGKILEMCSSCVD